MDEIFGFIKATCNHPYCKCARNYIKCDFDILGIYYPHGKGVNFIIYDVYSKKEIRDVVMQELLNWEYIQVVKTSKFQIVDEDVRNSFVLSIIEKSENMLESCIKKNKRYKFEFESNASKLTSESSYQRKTEGIKIPLFENFYNSLHGELFGILQKLSIRGVDVFASKQVQVSKKEYDILPSIINSLKEKKPIVITKDECNLGNSFISSVVEIKYIPEMSKNLNVVTEDKKILLNTKTPDLTFLDTNELENLLEYTSSFGTEKYRGIELAVLKELSKRKRRF